MNLVTLSLAGLRDARLTHALNILILAMGVATVTLLLLFSGTATDRLLRDGRGIDMVVGAKGSPLQLVLSTVFQTDIPTGNIDLAELQTLARNPMIRRAVPLALGDATHSFRIVGTTPEYLALYNAHLAAGRVFQQPMEAVLGAQTAQRLHLHVGDQFVGAHGVNGNGELHSAFPYTVTGILAPTGAVIDRLALTPVESVWRVHADEHTAADPAQQITAVLVQARTPLALVMLPYMINLRTPYMAAIPAQQAARLFSLLGFGLAAFRALAWVLIASAGLGMLIALTTRLRERRQELATLRLLGASRSQLFISVLIEALILATLGALLGLALGHAGAWVLSVWFPSGQAMASIEAGWRPTEWGLLALAIGMGLLAAAIPAITAYRSDVSPVLGAGA
jgi:putative ABC transport system permease protein